MKRLGGSIRDLIPGVIILSLLAITSIVYAQTWQGQGFQAIPYKFASLPPEQDGRWVFCSDCAATTPATPNGTGAFCVGIAGQYSCQYGNTVTTIFSRAPKLYYVTDFNAKCDGSTDDSTAFTTAMTTVNANAPAKIVFPGGTCVVNSTINITANGVVLEGAGWKATKFTTSTASLPQIVVSGGITDWNIHDIWLTRSVTATSGGDGIDACLTTAPCNNPLIQNVFVDSAYQGMKLGPTAYGTLRKIILQSNQQEGILFAGQSFTSGNSLQWTMWDVLSQLNNQHGFNALANTSGGPGTLAPWHDAYTFANGTGGIVVAGVGSAVMSDIQIVGGFFGSDCADEININSNNGGAVVITGNLIEQAGQAACGIGRAIPATHIGDGIHVSSTTTDVMISGNRVQTSSFSCIETASPRITITGNMLFDCGLASVAGNLDGIVVTAASVDANVTGNEMDLNNGYGLRQTGGTVNMTGDVCVGNVVGTHVGTIASNTGGAC